MIATVRRRNAASWLVIARNFSGGSAILYEGPDGNKAAQIYNRSLQAAQAQTSGGGGVLELVQRDATGRGILVTSGNLAPAAGHRPGSAGFIRRPNPRGRSFFKTFFEEKGIDPEEQFQVFSKGGTWNLMSYGVVMDAISKTQGREKQEIEMMLRRIDFENGDVRHYLRHLAQALARDNPRRAGHSVERYPGRLVAERLTSSGKFTMHADEHMMLGRPLRMRKVYSIRMRIDPRGVATGGYHWLDARLPLPQAMWEFERIVAEHAGDPMRYYGPNPVKLTTRIPLARKPKPAPFLPSSIGFNPGKSARSFFSALDTYQRWELGDELVLGTFDWRDWLNDKPTPAFMRELGKLSDYWEQTRPNPRGRGRNPRGGHAIPEDFGVTLPRAFRTWATKTYGWRVGDFARIAREKPSVLRDVVAYWESGQRKNPFTTREQRETHEAARKAGSRFETARRKSDLYSMGFYTGAQGAFLDTISRFGHETPATRREPGKMMVYGGATAPLQEIGISFGPGYRPPQYLAGRLRRANPLNKRESEEVLKECQNDKYTVLTLIGTATPGTIDIVRTAARLGIEKGLTRSSFLVRYGHPSIKRAAVEINHAISALGPLLEKGGRAKNPRARAGEIRVIAKGGYLYHPAIQAMRDTAENREQLARFHEQQGERCKFIQENPSIGRAASRLRGLPFWTHQIMETARDERDARQMLDALAIQDGFLGGRILPPSVKSASWQVQAFIGGSPTGGQRAKGFLPLGVREVMVPGRSMKGLGITRRPASNPFTKKALRHGPQGMFLECVCKRALAVPRPFSSELVYCPCGTVFNSSGWIVEEGKGKNPRPDPRPQWSPGTCLACGHEIPVGQNFSGFHYECLGSAIRFGARLSKNPLTETEARKLLRGAGVLGRASKKAALVPGVLGGRRGAGSQWLAGKMSGYAHAVTDFGPSRKWRERGNRLAEIAVRLSQRARNPLTAREVALLVREARRTARASQREWRDEPLQAAYYKGEATAGAGKKAKGRARNPEYFFIHSCGHQARVSTPVKYASQREETIRSTPCQACIDSAAIRAGHVGYCKRCGAQRRLAGGACEVCGTKVRFQNPTAGASRLKGHKPGCGCIFCSGRMGRKNPLEASEAARIVGESRRARRFAGDSLRYGYPVLAAEEFGRAMGLSAAVKTYGAETRVRQHATKEEMRGLAGFREVENRYERYGESRAVPKRGKNPLTHAEAQQALSEADLNFQIARTVTGQRRGRFAGQSVGYASAVGFWGPPGMQRQGIEMAERANIEAESRAPVMRVGGRHNPLTELEARHALGAGLRTLERARLEPGLAMRNYMAGQAHGRARSVADYVDPSVERFSLVPIGFPQVRGIQAVSDAARAVAFPGKNPLTRREAAAEIREIRFLQQQARTAKKRGYAWGEPFMEGMAAGTANVIERRAGSKAAAKAAQRAVAPLRMAPKKNPLDSHKPGCRCIFHSGQMGRKKR